MVTIIFEAHATTSDNEARRSSGHHDVDLSDLGRKQAAELGQRYQTDDFDAIFCSDLQRSYRTAELAFADRSWPIIRDARLRECDYGALTLHPSSEVEAAKASFIAKPFPDGESYQDTARRMGEFLHDLAANHNGRRVMIIGHRATQYGLEHWLNGVPLETIVTASWHWQPGWTYHLGPASTT